MKMSLFQGILLGIFGFGALVGLFVFATYSNSGSGADASVGTVLIWGTIPKDQFMSAVTVAGQTDQAFKNVSYTEKSASSFQYELASAIATGVGPDLIFTSQEQLHTLKKLIQPIPSATLPSRTFTDTFADGAGIFLIPNDGGTYAVPLLIDPLVMFQNRTILSSNGIAAAPSTWEALTGLVPRVAVTTSSQSITRSLIALGTYDNVDNARGILSALLQQTGVPVSVRNSAGGLSASLGKTSESGSGVVPGSAVLRFYTQFADSAKVSYTWNGSLPNSREAFLAGDLALYLGYASEARFISNANPNLYYDVRPLPQPSTATVKSTYGLFYGPRSHAAQRTLRAPTPPPYSSPVHQTDSLQTQRAWHPLPARFFSLHSPRTRPPP